MLFHVLCVVCVCVFVVCVCVCVCVSSLSLVSFLFLFPYFFGNVHDVVSNAAGDKNQTRENLLVAVWRMSEEALLQVLRDSFGFQDFRGSHQRRAIKAVVSGQSFPYMRGLVECVDFGTMQTETETETETETHTHTHTHTNTHKYKHNMSPFAVLRLPCRPPRRVSEPPNR